MYLLYVDESGSPDGHDSKHFVLGGIAAFETQPYWLNLKAEQVATYYFPSGSFVEFHAQELAAHMVEPWHSMPTALRNEIADRIFEVIGASRKEVVLFAVALEKSFTSDPVAVAFEELCNRFDLFLSRLRFQKNEQKGLLVFDETRYEGRLQKLLSEYRTLGTRFGKLKNLADIPLFTDSKSTRMLQLADFIAYAVYRRYERGDTRLLDKIIHKFDAQEHVIHGLSHLSPYKSSCTCPGCLSKRLGAMVKAAQITQGGPDRVIEVTECVMVVPPPVFQNLETPQMRTHEDGDEETGYGEV
jgi:Protein of unknown function (DUF3800)